MEENKPILVLGHKNPDTDCTCSSIVYAKILEKVFGLPAKPVRLGDLNKETLYVLEKFGIDVPEFIDSVEGYEVILVDHNELTQSADDIEKAKLKEIIDHHRINLKWKDPISITIRPVGSTCSIIADLFLQILNYEDIPFSEEEVKKLAGLLLSGILSDTVLFKSVTTTDYDKEVAKILSEISNINIESYGLELLKKKSDISDKSIKDIILEDSKLFDFNGKKVLIGQVELIDSSILLDKKEEILNTMEQIKKEQNLFAVVFMLTDTMKEGTYLFVVADDYEPFRKAFNKDFSSSIEFLEGVMSRKKQIVPPLEKALS